MLRLDREPGGRDGDFSGMRHADWCARLKMKKNRLREKMGTAEQGASSHKE